MLVGDFNADFSTVQGTYLCNLCEASNLTLHVQEPTRITPFSRSTLDQIISSSPTFVSDVKVNPPIANCDHCVISAICNFKVVKQQPYKRLMWQFSDTNFDRFRDSLTQVDWNINTGDINRSTLNFTEKLLEVAKATIPNKVVMIRSTDKPWYNSYLRRIKRKVLRFFKYYKLQHDHTSFSQFRKIAKFYQKEINKCKKEYNDSKLTNLSTKANKNTKIWWKLLKNVYKGNDSYESIPPLEINNNTICLDHEKATAFNNYFCSITQ